MEIRFKKDTDDDYIFSKTLSMDEILLLSNEESEYDNIIMQRYFKYNIATKVKEEILPGIQKIDLITIEDFGFQKNMIYFCTYENNPIEKGKVSLLRYNLSTKIIDVIFQFEDDITLYPLHKSITIYILNDSFLFVQEGYLKSTRSGNFDSISEFKLYLYEVSSNVTYPIVDERLVSNGIYTMFANSEVFIIKTGTTLLADNRWDYFNRDEAPSEYILIANKADFIQSIISLTTNIPLTVVDHENWDKTINYFSFKDNYIFYTKTSYPSYDEEFLYYNCLTQQSYSWKSKNTGNGECYSARHLIIKNLPYIAIQKFESNILKNLSDSSEEVKLSSDGIIKDSVGDKIIIQTTRQRSKDSLREFFVGIYKFPEMELLTERKGIFLNCINTNKYLVCIVM